MFLGRVVGSVWSTVKWPQIQGLKLLSVQPYHVSDFCQPADLRLPSCSDLVVCADIIDAGVGDEVLVAYGHAARVALEQYLGPGQQTRYPIDAAIVAIIDDLEVDSAAIADSRAE